MWIDHLVWYGAGLIDGRRYFEQRMDEPPAYGGEHLGEGTANYLLSLGERTYLEILGRDPAQSEAALDPEIRLLEGRGLYHWAVGGIDLRQLKERTIQLGSECGELVEGGRKRPDGSHLRWTCFGLRNHRFGALLPFFIDWMDSEHPARAAPRGGSLVDFEVFTPEAEPLRLLYAALGLDVRVTSRREPGFVATLEGRSGRHELHSFVPLPRGYVI